MNLWEQIKDRLATRLPWEGFQSWIQGTVQAALEGSSLLVAVPNSATKDWIESEYLPQINRVIAELNLPVRQVVFQPSGQPSGQQAQSNGQSLANGSAPAAIDKPASGGDTYLDALFDSVPLNPRYTFDHFVVGSSNEFAHAAARAAADKPGVTYNPLFIYGNSGLGKTHLMHAIGHHLIAGQPGLRVVCTTGDRFMNTLVQCIRTDTMPQFHEYYRSADILLVDDVHTMAGRERTQEEFFHTFNELYDRGKQIVLSSDSPPRNTNGLVDRLKTRFEWGLIVDIQAPDLETKMAILEKRAMEDNLDLPEDVRVFVATKVRSNIRELESSLRRLSAYSSVTGTPISLDMARQVLRPLGNSPERRVTIETVIKAVAERYSLQPAQLKQKGNMRNISFPRQIAMYLAKELTSASLPEIGRAFNGKHHTTVLHSVTKISAQRQSDPDLNRVIHSLIETLH